MRSKSWALRAALIANALDQLKYRNIGACFPRLARALDAIELRREQEQRREREAEEQRLRAEAIREEEERQRAEEERQREIDNRRPAALLARSYSHYITVRRCIE